MKATTFFVFYAVGIILTAIKFYAYEQQIRDKIETISEGSKLTKVILYGYTYLFCTFYSILWPIYLMKRHIRELSKSR